MSLSDLARDASGVAPRTDHTRIEIPRGRAPARLRLPAALVDLAVTALPLVVGVLIVRALADGRGGGEVDRLVFATLAVAAAVGVHVWNIGFEQGRTGASVGKAWFGLVARGRDGQPLGPRGSLSPRTPREVVRRPTAVDEGFTERIDAPSPAVLRRRRVLGLLALVVLLVAVLFASVAIGARPLSFGEVWAALAPPYDVPLTDADLIIQDLRLPRTLLALVTGIALGMAGALIQGHTRNPLADPGLLGVTAGASCAVVLAIAFLGVASVTGYIWFALAGAFVTTAVVFGLSSMGSGGDPSPLTLILGGAAVAAFLSSITAAVVLLDQTTLDSFRFWVVGSVAGRGPEVLVPLLPFFLVGFVLALVNAPGLNLLSLGDDVARALGSSIWINRVAGLSAMTLLAGAATAACGPIGFVGLVVPHMARAITGPDYRWILPFSAVIGAIMLILCDVIGRVVARPGELQAGIVLALIGGPFFIALVRRRRLVTL